MLHRMRNIWREGIDPDSSAALTFAGACFLVAVSVQMAVGTVLDGLSPFRAYFPAILIATLIAGRRAGVLVVGLATLAGWDAMMRPFLSLNVPDLTEIEDTLFFLLTSAVILWVAEGYRRMLRNESGGEARAPLIEQVAEHIRLAFKPAEAPPKEAAEAPKAQDDPTAGLIVRYSEQLHDAFARLIPRDRPVALIDYPDSRNCGDHAIWLGEKALLARLGITPAYECSSETYRREEMQARLGDGTILMHGGGNFGDRYTQYHEFRLRVFKEFPNNKTIVFPQQTTFLNNSYLQRTADAIAGHRDLTLFGRGVVTHHLMQQYFGATAKVLPATDMAFMLGRLKRLGDPFYDILWLSRDDQEKTTGNGVETVAGVTQIKSENFTLPLFDDGLSVVLEGKRKSKSVFVTDWYGLSCTSHDVLDTVRRLPFDVRSQFYLDRARFILSLGHIVITDRLHGHILCLMLGKPHVFLNNDSGKNWNFYDTWTRESPLCRLARNPKEAWDLAHKALPAVKAAGPDAAEKLRWM